MVFFHNFEGIFEIQKQGAVGNIESGKNLNPTLDTIKKIAEVLDVSIDDLVQ